MGGRSMRQGAPRYSEKGPLGGAGALEHLWRALRIGPGRRLIEGLGAVFTGRHSTLGELVLAIAGLIAAKLLMDGLVAANRWLFAKDHAPLSVLWQDRQVGLTVNAVFISVLRYIIYFVLFGWILSEMGVNVGTYLASVSFIAIAIGFGTQGLVQDLVTGFFIIFERQLDLGDVVTINGQTGVVEDFGLRLARIRGYDGSLTTIPNRSILQVVNYRARFAQAAVDAAVLTDAADAPAKLAKVLTDSGYSVALQFAGAVHGGLRLEPWQAFPGGGGYLRARLAFWPGQTWVVESQWLPRVQQGLAAAGINAADCLVAVHYYGEADGGQPAGLGRRKTRMPRDPQPPEMPPAPV